MKEASGNRSMTVSGSDPALRIASASLLLQTRNNDAVLRGTLTGEDPDYHHAHHPEKHCQEGQWMAMGRTAGGYFWWMDTHLSQMGSGPVCCDFGPQLGLPLWPPTSSFSAYCAHSTDTTSVGETLIAARWLAVVHASCIHNAAERGMHNTGIV
jgi:hypothetical protein